MTIMKSKHTKMLVNSAIRRKFRITVAGAIVAIVLGAASTSNAEFHVGTGIVCAWDFSDSSGAVFELWDVSCTIVRSQSSVDGCLLLIEGGSTAELYMVAGATELSEVTKASSNPADYSCCACWYPSLELVYVVRTREGHYAKLQIIAFSEYFNYVYQDDGSLNLDYSVSVETTTWGSIKALYED